jgi:hypothetical protein
MPDFIPSWFRRYGASLLVVASAGALPPHSCGGAALQRVTVKCANACAIGEPDGGFGVISNMREVR